jgi:hypothetical protein
VILSPCLEHETLGVERVREQPLPNGSAARDVERDADQAIGASLSDCPELEESVAHDPQRAAGVRR